MSCFAPTFIQRMTNIVTGEVQTKFIPHNRSNFIETNDVLIEKYNGRLSSDIVYRNIDGRWASEFIQIPCGKCIGCRVDYSRSWADRMTYHSFGKEDCSYFITLTYDDDHLADLPHSDNYDVVSLNFDDMTEFIKRLRNNYRDSQIDYYYSGEYGDQNFRPHFHLIVYNICIDDLSFFKLDNEGVPIYTSDKIDRLWQKGIVAISTFAWRSAAYTASYVEKKRDGRLNCEYTAVGIEPERCRMSRRPGIAYDYYMDHYADLWKNNGLEVSRDVNRSGMLGIPRYFRKLAESKGIGFDEFQSWRDRVSADSNFIHFFNSKNNGYDTSDVARIQEMLNFQEREILSRKKNKKI